MSSKVISREAVRRGFAWIAERVPEVGASCPCTVAGDAPNAPDISDQTCRQYAALEGDLNGEPDPLGCADCWLEYAIERSKQDD